MKKKVRRKIMYILIMAILFSPINTITSGENDKSQIENVRDGIIEISSEKAYQMIDSDVVILDVRGAMEYEECHIKNALLLPLSDMYCDSCFHQKLDNYRDKKIIVYCESEEKSKVACDILIQHGFRNVHYLRGGINAWVSKGFPITNSSEGHFCGCEDSSTEYKNASIDRNQKCLKESEKYLAQIKRAIKEHGANWTAGYTTISNLTYNIGGWPGVRDEKIEEYPITPLEGILPKEFDWRNVNGTDWTTPIKNQGGCGSCVAFATIAALESVVQINVGRPFDCDLSEAHLFFCGGGSCKNGWYFQPALEYLKNYGVPDEACFPYRSAQTPCSYTESNWRERATKVISFGAVSGGIEYIKYALIKYGPLITRMDWYQDFAYYTGGVYEHVWGNYVAGHAVTIVGYNDNGGYWICKNSMGTGWGERGWFRIKYGECRIGDPTYYLYGISGDIQPFPPSNPTPYDGEKNVEVKTTLSWTCEDADGDDLYYDVYLARGRMPTTRDIIARDYPYTHLPVTLEENSLYYWIVFAKDEHGSVHAGPTWRFSTIETVPPNVEIVVPEEGYLYWNWWKMPIPSQNSIVIGAINVDVDASDSGSGVDRVEFYVNDALRYTKNYPPYKWEWNEKSLGLNLYRLKVTAYDNAGNSASDEIRVRIFNP